MKAKLLPLKQKYYCTEIEIDFQDGGSKEILKLNDDSNSDPSIRELKSLGYTQKQWNDNIIITDGWNNKVKIRESDIINSDHFENKLTYNRALDIISKLNK